MLLYGCGEPGADKSVWNCGEMNGGDDMDEESYPTCAPGSSSQIVYAWARDAPKLSLPTDVGFKVGADSPIKYLVLQVHYMSKFPKNKRDDSGIYNSKHMLKFRLKKGNKNLLF